MPTAYSYLVGGNSIALILKYSLLRGIEYGYCSRNPECGAVEIKY